MARTIHSALEGQNKMYAVETSGKWIAANASFIALHDDTNEGVFPHNAATWNPPNDTAG